MSLSLPGPLGRLRQPEYTGDNRCYPCTIVNISLAGVLAAVLGALGSLVLALAAFGALLALIYLRGYLVPGTPAVTKRYLPPWVLESFGKQVATGGALADDGGPVDIDVEAVLIRAGLLVECEDGEDLCPEPAFETAWIDQMETLADDEPRQLEVASGLLERTPDGLGLAERGHGETVHLVADEELARWPSRSALLADLAATVELADRLENWQRYSPQQRAALVAALRLFVETCPNCSGPVVAEEDVRESCCSTHEYVVVSCGDCETEVLRRELDGV